MFKQKLFDPAESFNQSLSQYWSARGMSEKAFRKGLGVSPFKLTGIFLGLFAAGIVVQQIRSHTWQQQQQM
jgi:hypothetical protein